MYDKGIGNHATGTHATSVSSMYQQMTFAPISNETSLQHATTSNKNDKNDTPETYNLSLLIDASMNQNLNMHETLHTSSNHAETDTKQIKNHRPNEAKRVSKTRSNLYLSSSRCLRSSTRLSKNTGCNLQDSSPRNRPSESTLDKPINKDNSHDTNRHDQIENQNLLRYDSMNQLENGAPKSSAFNPVITNSHSINQIDEANNFTNNNNNALMATDSNDSIHLGHCEPFEDIKIIKDRESNNHIGSSNLFVGNESVRQNHIDNDGANTENSAPSTNGAKQMDNFASNCFYNNMTVSNSGYYVDATSTMFVNIQANEMFGINNGNINTSTSNSKTYINSLTNTLNCESLLYEHIMHNKKSTSFTLLPSQYQASLLCNFYNQQLDMERQKCIDLHCELVGINDDRYKRNSIKLMIKTCEERQKKMMEGDMTKITTGNPSSCAKKLALEMMRAECKMSRARYVLSKSFDDEVYHLGLVSPEHVATRQYDSADQVHNAFQKIIDLNKCFKADEFYSWYVPKYNLNQQTINYLIVNDQPKHIDFVCDMLVMDEDEYVSNFQIVIKRVVPVDNERRNQMKYLITNMVYCTSNLNVLKRINSSTSKIESRKVIMQKTCVARSLNKAIKPTRQAQHTTNLDKIVTKKRQKRQLPEHSFDLKNVDLTAPLDP
jgi:hypothetical protein